MKRLFTLKRPRGLLLTFGCAAVWMAATLTAQTRQISSSGTGFFSSTPTATENGNGPELDPALTSADTHDTGPDATGAVSINRTVGHGTRGEGVPMSGHKHAKSNPALNLSIDGLNFFEQRFASGGNQFSVEP